MMQKRNQTATQSCIKNYQTMTQNSIDKTMRNLRSKKPSEIEPWNTKRVAKVTSAVRWREGSGQEGSPGNNENRTFLALDHPARKLKILYSNIEYSIVCI